MQKVLHLSKYYYPFRGGVEQIAQDCVTALSQEYKQKVICFHHINSIANDEVDEVDGIEITRCKCITKLSSQSISLSYAKNLEKLMKEFNPDIIIFHYPNPFVARYLLKYIGSDTKLVLYWHLDITKQKILKHFVHFQNLHLIHRANCIITTSPPYIEGSPYLRKVKEKCIVIPNCVNVDRMQITDEATQIAQKITVENTGKIICLAVGRHTKYKGFKYLIRASKLLPDNFVVYITGEGELSKSLKKEAAGDAKIHFLGLLTDDELKAYLQACDIFCFPSITKNEAFGVALAEAMYFEKPALTFTIKGSGVNYVNLHNVTGIEVPNKDVKAYAEAMTRLAADEQLRHQFGENAKQRVEENFLSSKYAGNVQDLMDIMTNKKEKQMM